MIAIGHAWDYRGEGLGVEFTLPGNQAKVVDGGYPPVYKEHLEEACTRQLGGWEGSLPRAAALEVGYMRASCLEAARSLSPPMPPHVEARVRRSGNRPLHVCKWLASEFKAIPDSDTFSSRERLPAAPVPQTTFTGGFRVPKVHEGLLLSM